MAWALLPFLGMENASQSLSGIYVLLVDNEPRHREILRDILRYCGAWVREADDVEEALGVLRETTPTALVVTVRGQGEMAWTLLRGVRAMRPEHGGKLPAVGVGPSALHSAALAEGFDLYLPEPIEAWALCGAVSEITA